jgi:hypothetical protein
MINTSGDNYMGKIPGQPIDNHIHYYIEVEANSGKKGKKPMVAPNWAYNFLIRPNGVNINGISKNISGTSTKVFPNPTSDKIYFDIQGFSTENCEIIIYDLWGKIVTTRTISSCTEVNTSSYLPGYYLYVIKDSKSSNYTTGQFIKE